MGVEVESDDAGPGRGKQADVAELLLTSREPLEVGIVVPVQGRPLNGHLGEVLAGPLANADRNLPRRRHDHGRALDAALRPRVLRRRGRRGELHAAGPGPTVDVEPSGAGDDGAGVRHCLRELIDPLVLINISSRSHHHHPVQTSLI